MIAQLNQWFTRLTDHPDAGKLLLRLTVGILLLFHGVAKIEHGVDWIVQILQGVGLPGFIAYGVYIGEVVAPILIILGVFTRVSGLIAALTLVVATLMVGTGKFFVLTKVGAWALELEALYFFAGIIIMLVGSGRYSVASNPAYR
ncbi:DoxX family protein [Pectobacterium polaris]|uniref:DoxX family protein n=1 Tax=Pectobacterium polaris TaxID=2042057 RepID=UPI000E711157|nr:DoxX family protein [Pectobacterium polaris]MDE8756992.1 DoxX family protein [Pectobacterium polaris]RJL27395.1 DoxX family protein [Pectobacterium polaris]